jgi:hypothetical protein
MSRKGSLRSSSTLGSWIARTVLPLGLFGTPFVFVPGSAGQEVSTDTEAPVRVEVASEPSLADGPLNAVEPPLPEVPVRPVTSKAVATAPSDPWLFESGPMRVKVSLDAVF